MVAVKFNSRADKASMGILGKFRCSIQKMSSQGECTPPGYPNAPPSGAADVHNDLFT